MSTNQVVQFNNQSIPVFFHNNKPYVAMKPICENIGLQWEAQYKRIQRNHILKQAMSMMDIVAQDGKNREMVTLPIGYLNGWLFGIDVNKVKPEIKDTLIKYQLECFDVLYNHFMPKVAAAHPNTITLEQQQAIKDAVLRKAQRDKRTYQSIYRDFYNAFDIPRYQELPLAKFEEAVRWLGDGWYQYKSSTTPQSQLDIMEILQDFVEQVIVTNHEMKKLCDALRVVDSRAFMVYAHHLVGSNELAREIAWKYDFKNKSGEPTIDMYCRTITLSNGLQFEVKPNWFNCPA